MIEQLAIFVENRPGSLRRVTRILDESNVKICGISSVDTPEFGILRLIVDDPETAKNHLEEEGFAVKVSDVIAVDMGDQSPLDRLLTVCQESNINVGYIYSALGKDSGHATFILCADDLEETESLLRGQGFCCLSSMNEKAID